MLLSFVIAVATVMSAVGICDRCDIGRGGVYFIITHVLGGKIGGAIGLLYCLGHVRKLLCLLSDNNIQQNFINLF